MPARSRSSSETPRTVRFGRTQISGISNKLDDKLSQRPQPTDGTISSRFITPDIVKQLEDIKLEKRDVKYYASRGDLNKLWADPQCREPHEGISQCSGLLSV